MTKILVFGHFYKLAPGTAEPYDIFHKKMLELGFKRAIYSINNATIHEYRPDEMESQVVTSLIVEGDNVLLEGYGELQR